MIAKGVVPSSSVTEAGGRDAAGITCRDVTVRFGDFTAVRSVTASFTPGTIHALVGQNGAGKTTLARVLAGLIEPDEGSVSLNGQSLGGGSVIEARAAGIELVHQHFALPADFTVAECFEMFANDGRRLGPFRRASVQRRAQELLEAAGLDVASDSVIGRLSVETLQALEITRALASDPRVLVLDEPTAVLPPPAMERLFERLRGLAASGLCVIVVLHKLKEVFAVADTISVLRGGELVLPATSLAHTTPDDLAARIVGAEAPRKPSASAHRPRGGRALRVRDLHATSGGHDAPAEAVWLEVGRGEIVGVAGVEGNGQRSLVEALVGVTPVKQGSIELTGNHIVGNGVAARRARGLRVIPFDRNTEGVSLTSSLWENHAVARGHGAGWWLHVREVRAACRQALERWQVSFRDDAQPMGDLSGGNVQKCVLAREMSGDPTLVLAAHPTRGLDLAAARYVQAALIDAAKEGAGVLLVSADLDEMMEICHRIVVMLGGRIVDEVLPPFDLERMGTAMTGSRAV